MRHDRLFCWQHKRNPKDQPMKSAGKLGLAMFAVLGAQAALANTPQRYAVTMEIQDNGVVIGKPRLIVASGEAARIEIGQPDGGQFSMGLVVNPKDQGTIGLRSTLTIRHAQGPDWTGMPALTVKPGTLSVIEVGGSAPDRKPTRIVFRIDAA
jgi:hypothetical protein